MFGVSLDGVLACRLTRSLAARLDGGRGQFRKANSGVARGVGFRAL